jgi:repressor LexA
VSIAGFRTQARPKGRPGRKPKGSVPVVVPQTPDKPDPDHVLTWRQRKVLRVIREWVQTRGYPPSMREIGDAVGLTSTSSVSYQLSILQRKGYLYRDVGRARTMEVRLPDRPPVRPEAPIEQIAVGAGTLFLLEVAGDAMVNAAIADGDLVVVRQVPDGDRLACTPLPGEEAGILGRVVAVLRQA